MLPFEPFIERNGGYRANHIPTLFAGPRQQPPARPSRALPKPGRGSPARREGHGGRSHRRSPHPPCHGRYGGGRLWRTRISRRIWQSAEYRVNPGYPGLGRGAVRPGSSARSCSGARVVIGGTERGATLKRAKSNGSKARSTISIEAEGADTAWITVTRVAWSFSRRE